MVLREWADGGTLFDVLNIGPGEIIVIALVLLITVGPEQLPGLIRRVGSAVSQVRGMTDSLRSEFMAGMDEIDRVTDPNAWAASAGPSDNAPKPKSTPPATPASDEPSSAEPVDDVDAADVSGNGAAAPPLDPASAAKAAGAMYRRRPEPPADVRPGMGSEPTADNEPAAPAEPAADTAAIETDAEPTETDAEPNETETETATDAGPTSPEGEDER